MQIRKNVEALQAKLKAARWDAWVVLSSDPHQSEYVADAWKRREFISGFTGSAGTFVCTQEAAGLWTDGRYYVQAAAELEGSGIQLHKMGMPGVLDWPAWLAQNVPEGGRIGFNPEPCSLILLARLEQECASRAITLVASTDDPVDAIWGKERPTLPAAPLREHRLLWAGESWEAKLIRLRQFLQTEGATAIVLSALDEIAWLLNLRGADVDYNPVFYSFVLVTADVVTLCVDPQKLSQSLRDLRPGLSIRPYNGLATALKEAASGGVVILDPATSSVAVRDLVTAGGYTLRLQQSPIPLWKARKNEEEQAGMRLAHIRDGVAMVNFLCWLEQALAAREILDEMILARRLQAMRQEQVDYLGDSFATISAFGPHGAQPHYRATPQTFRVIETPGIYLVDSGAQYCQGTTDITRTLAIGTPDARQREIYTRVLKGHLQLARTRFLVGTNGYQLDMLARQALWAVGLDYAHGTGHGVGAGLCVHEGPFGLSLRKNMIPLEAGNILSNEPACYLVGEFGVRIENLLVVTPAMTSAFGEFLGFDDLTLCPYDRSLIDSTLLSAEERRQVDTYHQRVYQTLAPLLGLEVRTYLRRATEPLPV